MRVFPSYNHEIGFAALSLDGKGVLSYGRCSLVLKSIAIARRATVFWENTVEFCNRVWFLSRKCNCTYAVSHDCREPAKTPQAATPWIQRL